MSDKVKVEVNIKSYKIGRILETLLIEALSDFERRHPRVIPSLKRAYRNGDPRMGLERIEELQKIVTMLKEDLAEVERVTKEYLSKDLEVEEGMAVGPFLNPEGKTTYSMKDDEKIVIGPDRKKKKAPAKKRATNKKAKKEEE